MVNFSHLTLFQVGKPCAFVVNFYNLTLFQVGKPCAFVVNFNGAPKGKLQARVVTPSGSEEEALVQEIDDGK